MYNAAQKYRIALYVETDRALSLSVDSRWKVNHFKALNEIKTDLPDNVRQRIFDEHCQELNKRLSALAPHTQS